MKKSRFTEEQIAYALKQVELGMAVGGVCRKLGIEEATVCLWRKKHGGPRPIQLKRMRLPDEENRKLRLLVDDPSLNKAMLQEVVTKSSEACPEASPGGSAQERFGSREQRALRIVSMTRSTLRKRACLCGIVGRAAAVAGKQSRWRQRHNTLWGMDFAIDGLFDGRRIRARGEHVRHREILHLFLHRRPGVRRASSV